MYKFWICNRSTSVSPKILLY